MKINCTITMYFQDSKSLTEHEAEVNLTGDAVPGYLGDRDSPPENAYMDDISATINGIDITDKLDAAELTRIEECLMEEAIEREEDALYDYCEDESPRSFISAVDSSGLV